MAGEAGGVAAQPCPDQEEERAGEAAPAGAAAEGLAQAPDDEGKTVGRGGSGDVGHDRYKTTTVRGWASSVYRPRANELPWFRGKKNGPAEAEPSC